MNDTVKERHIPVSYDSRGNPCWKSVMTPPDNSVALCYMVPDRIIPVIFVPGVMGSNLRERGANPKRAVRWRLDDEASAGRWALPKYDARFRKQYLVPSVMEVDNDGKLPESTKLPAEELKRRGWGEVGYLSYGEWLAWLENTLNDFDEAKTGWRQGIVGQVLNAMTGEEPLSKDEVNLSYRYRFAVHACGYNWLDSNAQSSERLRERIHEIVRRYRAERRRCEKVILVTHSMGGLVARHCSEVLGMRHQILGIVHGVMPAIGAAAVYRRCKAGTEDMTAWYDAAGAATASALGNDAAEMTAVMSSAPGPLQLLPTPEYGNGWLRVSDGKHTVSLPQKGDPYAEIYTVRGKWWSLCEGHLINPLNEEKDPKKRQAVMDRDWEVFATMVLEKVKQFHKELKQRYHPATYAFLGSHRDNPAYGNVTWTSSPPLLLAGQNPADIWHAKATDPDQIEEERTVKFAERHWWQRSQSDFEISLPEEAGDGTVPVRSGVAPTAHAKSLLAVKTDHEPAFKAGPNLDLVRRFTVRAIIKIAQDVRHTSLAYE